MTDGTVHVRPNGRRRRRQSQRMSRSKRRSRSARGRGGDGWGLSQDGRRRRSPLATAASHEWRRGTLHGTVKLAGV
jgi:hypothetical protein